MRGKKKGMELAEPLIIQYTNILHNHGGPDSNEAKNFLKLHSSDKLLTKRAETLNRLYKLKKRK